MSLPDSVSDNPLWQRLKEDDREALGCLYEKYADYLLAYGLSIVYNRDIVKDAVQELFLQVWSSRHRLTIPDSSRYYLMASVRRLILKIVKEEQTLADGVEERSEEQGCENEEEVRQLVLNAVRTLPPRQQELIFLKFYEKMSYDEISALTGLEYQILRNTICRAVKSLRSLLASNADLPTLTLFLVAFL